MFGGYRGLYSTIKRIPIKQPAFNEKYPTFFVHSYLHESKIYINLYVYVIKIDLYRWYTLGVLFEVYLNQKVSCRCVRSSPKKHKGLFLFFYGVPPDYQKFPAGKQEMETLPSANPPEKASSAPLEGAVPPDYPKFPAGKQEMERLPSANLPGKASSAPLEGAVPPDYPKIPAGNEEMERLPSAKLPQKTPSALSEGAVPPDYPKFPADKQEMERLPSANLPGKASSAPSEGAVPPDYPKLPAGNEEMKRLPSAKLPQKTPSALSEGAVPPDYPKFPASKQEMERLPSANPPGKASSAPSEGAVRPDYPKIPAGNEEMERLPSAKLPQKTPSALSEEVVLPDNLDLIKVNVLFHAMGFITIFTPIWDIFLLGHLFQTRTFKNIPKQSKDKDLPGQFSKKNKEPWSRDINSLNPTLTQRSSPDGLSRKGPGLSVQTSEALSGVSDTGRKREVGTMSDSFKEKLPLNMGETWIS